MNAAFPISSIGFVPGDVVSLEARDHWLEGAWLLSEVGEPIVAVFFASDVMLAVFAVPRTDLFRLTACELVLSSDAPFSLELDGTRFEREQRLAVKVSPFGLAPEPPEREALFLEYRAFGGERLFVLSSAAQSQAWRGSPADKSRVERWGARG